MVKIGLKIRIVKDCLSVPKPNRWEVVASEFAHYVV